MSFLLFLIKPVLYVLAFAVLSEALVRGGTKMKGRVWRVLLAALGRLVVGALVGSAALMLAADHWGVLFGVLIVPLGALAWFGAARLAFRETPLSQLLAFTLIAEVVSGSIDAWAWHDIQSISFC